jgi:non-ribosomal peptide synthetase-like protein
VVLDALPLAGSGKLDRNALPWPPPEIEGPTDPDLSGTAAWLAERFSHQLGPVAISAETDFFASGGSSLAAAKLTSALRERFPSVAVSDVYEYRRLGALAARLDELGQVRGEQPPALPTASWRWGAVQLAGLLVLLVIHASEWLIGAFLYADVLAALHVASGLPQVPWPWLLCAWLVLATPMGRTGIVLGAKRLLLPRLTPGRYPRHSSLACRIWFLERLTEVCHLGRLAGTPWADRYARLLGAEVGADARLGSVPLPGALVHIGAGATLEADVDMHGWWMDGQEIVVGEVRIGAGARVGTRAMLMPGARVGEGAEVEPGSVVTGAIPDRERWAGAPARYEGQAGEGWLEKTPASDPWPRSSLALYAAGLLVGGLLPVLAFLPGVLAVHFMGASTPTLYSSPGAIALEALVLTSTFLLSYALLVAGVVRLTWRLLKPGWHVERGLVGWAQWFSENVLASARGILFPLYCSLFTRSWLRLMGVRVGRRCEISTAVGLNNLVSFEELSFAADDVSLSSARARHGWLHMEPIAVGQRTFLGNTSILKQGTKVGANSIIGVLTVAPPVSADSTCWLGSPALELPRAPDTSDPARTTDPPVRLILARGAMDLVRILLPWTASLLLGWSAFIALSAIGTRLGILVEVGAAPLVLLAAGLAAAVLTILMKWVVMGRYRSGEHAFWSFFVWRDELINSAQEMLAGQWLIRFAMATPLMSPYLRALGARIGRGVWCDTMAITEFDLVEMHDGAVVNRQGCIETHLFHDRLLRLGPATLGAGSTLGPSSVVLPDTKLGAGTCVGARSVVMRGEELPEGTRWHGAPVVAIPARSS